MFTKKGSDNTPSAEATSTSNDNLADSSFGTDALSKGLEGLQQLFDRSPALEQNIEFSDLSAPNAQRVQEALGALGNFEQAIIEAKLFQGLSAEEIGQAAGVEPALVQDSYDNVLRKLSTAPTKTIAA